MQRTILITHEVHGVWQLREQGAAPVTIVGWRSTREFEVDSGPAPEIELILGRALTEIALVTFPLSDSPNTDDEVRVLKESNPLRRLRDRLARIPASIHFVSTRCAPSVSHVFNDGCMSWPMQTIFALLSVPESRAPDLTRTQVLEVIDAQAIDFAAWPSILGALFPGVDGDMAMLVCRDRAFQEKALLALERSASAAGYDWRVCPSADEFEDALADEGGASE